MNGKINGSKIEIKNKKLYKIVSIISSASLGVYLIHVHAIPWSMLSN